MGAKNALPVRSKDAGSAATPVVAARRDRQIETDDEIERSISEAKHLLAEGLMKAVEAGRLLRDAKQATSQKARSKQSDRSWKEYLADAGLARQTADDAIRFADAFDATKSEAKRAKALEAPSRNKALEILGVVRRRRNNSIRPADARITPTPTPTPQQPSHADLSISVAPLLDMLSEVRDQLQRGRLRLKVDQRADLRAACELLANEIDRQQDNHAAVDGVIVVVPSVAPHPVGPTDAAPSSCGWQSQEQPAQTNASERSGDAHATQG